MNVEDIQISIDGFGKTTAHLPGGGKLSVSSIEAILLAKVLDELRAI